MKKQILTRSSKLYYSREKYNLTRSRDRRRSARHWNKNLTPVSLTPDYQRGRDSRG